MKTTFCQKCCGEESTYTYIEDHVVLWVFRVSYQEDRVEAWLGLPLFELLLCRLQHCRVLAGGLSQGLQHHRTGTVYIHNCEDTRASERTRAETEERVDGKKEVCFSVIISVAGFHWGSNTEPGSQTPQPRLDEWRVWRTEWKERRVLHIYC